MAFASAASQAGVKTWPLLTAMANSFRRALVRREVEGPSSTVLNGRGPLTFYVDLMKAAGPPGRQPRMASMKNLALFKRPASAACGIDATVSRLVRQATPRNPRSPTRSISRSPPTAGLGQGGELAVGLDAGGAGRIEEGRRRRKKFISWATSKDYIRGWSRPRRAWANVAARHNTQVAFTVTRNTSRRRPFAQSPTLRPRIQLRRPDPRHGQAQALRRRAVRGDPPEFQGIATGRRSAVCRGLDRHRDRRRGAWPSAGRR